MRKIIERNVRDTFQNAFLSRGMPATVNDISNGISLLTLTSKKYMQIGCYHPSPTFYNVNEAVIGEKIEIADLCVY